MLRLLCLSLLLSSLSATADSLRVVIDRQDYFPHYRVADDRLADGLGPDLLRLFAEHQGLQLRFEPLPVKRVYHRLRNAPDIDLAYPDNPAWSLDLKQGMSLHYSRHSLAVLDGTLVLSEHLGRGEARVKKLGLVRGFTPQAWQAQLARSTVQLVEASDLDALVHMLQRGRIDALYANPEVVRHRLLQMGLAADSVRLDPGLPGLVTRYHLSSVRRPELIEGFDRFLDDRPELLPSLHLRYGIPE